MGTSVFFQQRQTLRVTIKKVERLQQIIEDQNIQELLENARIDLSNALNIANAIRKKHIHPSTRGRVLRLIIAGVTIKKICLECKVSHDYITKLMRANDIRRYRMRNRK